VLAICTAGDISGGDHVVVSNQRGAHRKTGKLRPNRSSSLNLQTAIPIHLCRHFRHRFYLPWRNVSFFFLETKKHPQTWLPTSARPVTWMAITASLSQVVLQGQHLVMVSPSFQIKQRQSNQHQAKTIQHQTTNVTVCREGTHHGEHCNAPQHQNPQAVMTISFPPFAYYAWDW
jgi:hypothetical protein